MRSSEFLRAVRVAVVGAGLALSSAWVSAAATVVLVNLDGPGEGLNDPTPAAPVGGNTGTTLGQQRQIALLHAANIWAASLNSTVPITIQVDFRTDLTCTATSATLASAGTRFVFRDFTGAGFAGTWYGGALANKLSGVDQAPGEDNITSRFNARLGNADCLAGAPFYLGLDNNEGAGIDIVTTAIHEFAHGLGFQALTSGATGARISGFPAVWEHFLNDDTTSKRWIDMTDAERVASAINFRRLSWLGPNATAGVPAVLNLGTPRLAVSGPMAGPAAGEYVIAPANFGPALSAPGVTADIMPVAAQAGDGGGNGCAPFNAANTAAVNGKIALITRGVCGFAVKVQNAQNAGAVGVVIQNNVAGSPIALGGTSSTITIPSLMVSLPDGNALRARLAFRSRGGSGVVGNLGVNTAQYAGANTSGRMLMFTPNPFQGGSSVSHWDTIATRNLVMEPAISADLVSQVVPPQDLTLLLLNDIGW